MTFKIKQGDTFPPLRAVLTSNDAPLNLANATVRFIMSTSDGLAKVNAPMLITDALAGKVEYRWQPQDTSIAGSYLGEFEISWDDGTKQTVPNDGYIDIIIVRELG